MTAVETSLITNPRKTWPADERVRAGQLRRREVPLAGHAALRPAEHRDPVALLEQEEVGRVPELVPIRHGRMLVSPFAFYRGTALLMADDLAAEPNTGIMAQLCGDAHLVNFGAYASRERSLVFDINDFDETLPGPFEWDVKRLVASVVVAGRDNGFKPKACRRAALAAASSYRTAMAGFAALTALDVWHSAINIDQAFADYKQTMSDQKQNRKAMKATRNALAKARTRDHLQAIRKLTRTIDGHRRIIAAPPLTVPVDQLPGADRDRSIELLESLLASYRDTLPDNRRHLLDQFQLADAALRVVGVGSVGTRAWILVLEGIHESDGVILQAKEARASVLAGYWQPSVHNNQGQRVVAGQRLIQASSDIFLGWVRDERNGEHHDYYLRQLRDWKMSLPIESMDPQGLTSYARLCGWTLARAHARSGDRFMITGYLGNTDEFDQAVVDFAEQYADQTERDYAALVSAVESGRTSAVTGI
ncbi:hypothetical protein GCM10011575_27220 [Microlunatus endophyticus]|uniref:DUF2252 domain-containing protein n=1 Tax=Microlunatus endophyticus TaxID=1716077 RepID=A0A917SBC5_9ACTN|nr:DUF2252 domain-containing protein [Microlunatus endophyticus]GGL67286.1 hypothetical protein GCM10011575_27220 [Microlunatus endophyticus]